MAGDVFYHQPRHLDIRLEFAVSPDNIGILSEEVEERTIGITIMLTRLILQVLTRLILQVLTRLIL